MRLRAKSGPATSISPSRPAFNSRIALSRSSATSVALEPTDFNERETIHFGCVRHAGLSPSLLDQVAKKRGAWRECHVIARLREIVNPGLGLATVTPESLEFAW